MKKVFILVGIFCVFFMTKNVQASFSTVDCANTDHLAILDIPQIECEALEALWHNTDGENWEDNYGWDTLSRTENWEGVGADNGHIYSIGLDDNRLNGFIPSEIGNLVELKSLYLEGNRFTGEIPSEIGQLSNLEELSLSSNLFETLPEEFSNLDSLKRLYLSNNNFSGDIPEVICDLDALEYLILDNNNFASIPSCIGSLSNLEYLSIESNNLTNLPSGIGNLSSLKSLYLRHNNITQIPSELGALSNLQSISLSYNQLSGSIPQELANLNVAKFSNLELGNNNLSGKIPDFTKFIWMDEFYIDNNNFVFADFESEHSDYELEFEDYRYNGQADVDTERSVMFDQNEELIIAPEVAVNPSGNDHYQWYKDGDEIADATDRIFTKEEITCADVGVYTYKIINSIIDSDELELSSENITVCTNECGCEVSNSEEDEDGESNEELRSDVDDLRSDVDGLEDDVDDLEDEVKDLKEKQADLEDELSGLKKDSENIDKINSELIITNNAIKELQDKLNELYESRGQTEKMNEDLKKEFEVFKEDMEAKLKSYEKNEINNNEQKDPQVKGAQQESKGIFGRFFSWIALFF